MEDLSRDIFGISESASGVMERMVRARELAETIKDNGEELKSAIESVAKKRRKRQNSLAILCSGQRNSIGTRNSQNAKQLTFIRRRGKIWKKQLQTVRE